MHYHYYHYIISLESPSARLGGGHHEDCEDGEGDGLDTECKVYADHDHQAGQSALLSVRYTALTSNNKGLEEEGAEQGNNVLGQYRKIYIDKIIVFLTAIFLCRLFPKNYI